MRIFNEIVIDAGVMTGTTVINSAPIWLGHIANWAVQLNWTKTGGTLTGAWKIQVSNAPAKFPDTVPAPDVIWTDLPSATGSVVDGATGSAVLNLPDAGYQWARIVYTNATGTGVLTARANGKGF